MQSLRRQHPPADALDGRQSRHHRRTAPPLPQQSEAQRAAHARQQSAQSGHRALAAARPARPSLLGQQSVRLQLLAAVAVAADAERGRDAAVNRAAVNNGADKSTGRQKQL